MFRPCSSLALAVVVFLAVSATQCAHAHPEDEFCVPGEAGIDPALCEALSALDSADAASARTDIDDGLIAVRGVGANVLFYIRVGIAHILPGGSDHILFVLALFLGVSHWRPMIWQISAFTLAHTVTLAMAASGLVKTNPDIVEPLIAATIALVALENLFLRQVSAWRPLMVFGFGLIHGLGFAGFFGQLGLPPGQFWSSLIGFNIGVELGQLAVLAIAGILMLALRRLAGWSVDSRQYRNFVVLPGSFLIAAAGLWWAWQRVFLP